MKEVGKSMSDQGQIGRLGRTAEMAVRIQLTQGEAINSFIRAQQSQARDDAGGGSQAAGGGLPPGDKGPPKGFSFGAGVEGAQGGNVSGQNDSSTFTNANDPLKGLDRY